MAGYGFPEILIGLIALHATGKRDEAYDLFDAHLPLIRQERQQGTGLAVRKHVLKRRGVTTSEVQRKPGSV